MSKRVLFIASILLTIIVGAVLFWYYCCPCEGSKGTAADKSIVPDEQVAVPEPEPAPAIDWQNVRQQLNDDPLTPIFEPYQTERALGQADLIMVDKIINYLNNNPGGSLLVVGHTDISGSRALNMRLSRERAEFMRSFLVQKGIDSGKIAASFKGPDEPAHDNSTFEGRAKNRRAVVLIK